MTHLRITRNWLEVWTHTTRNKLVTGMQPLHPWHDCDGCIELVAYQESGAARLLGTLTETCTGMLAPQQCSPTIHFWVLSLKLLGYLGILDVLTPSAAQWFENNATRHALHTELWHWKAFFSVPREPAGVQDSLVGAQAEEKEIMD